MPSPSYVNLSGAVKGLASAETGLCVDTLNEEYIDPKEFLLDESGGKKGWAHAFDESIELTLTGETTAATPLSIAYGTATTITNATGTLFGITTGGTYPDTLTLSHSREGWKSLDAGFMSVNTIA